MKNNKSFFSLIELFIATSLLALIILAGSGIYLSGWLMSRDAQFMMQAQRNAMGPMAHMEKKMREGANSFSGGTKPGVDVYGSPPDFSQPPTIERVYIYDQNQQTITYTPSSYAVPQQTFIIGRNIQSFNCTTAHSDTILNVTITATDNNGQNPYTLTSSIRATYTSVPPVY